MAELAYLSASEALSAFRARTLSPVELTQAVLERAERVEPRIGAFADTYFDEALEQAKSAEQRYAGKGEPSRPLEGVLIGLKDEEPHSGRRNTNGSLIVRNRIDEYDSPVVERILAAGGIIHARTRTPEF